MSIPIHFTASRGNLFAYSCIWQDELKLFPDAESACRWAGRRGLKAVFVKDEPEPETEPGRVEYRFLGVTGCEDE
ncbi:hypothetical protein [Burkholderia cepacia]|uniref:hypothetical protein n=1 Tax=Burkholderia cepacia TaxID=292 RepID=UPI0007581FD1|nr:hypothetical protein [Burkholderia cepacia]KWF90376.1 hypothetical protein WL95_27495 [Burkholderia cepacia]